MLQPAAAHISEFTRKIDRGRVLRVGTVMEAIRPGLDGPPVCSADALPIMTTAPNEEVPVVDRPRNIVGAFSTVRQSG